MVSQARMLIAKLKADPRVNYTHDWKMVTLFIGGNDLCESCIDPVSLVLFHILMLL